MDLSPANEDSDNGSATGESQAPAALALPAGITPDQLRRGRKHRRKYGLALSGPNSPKPKKLSSQKSSKVTWHRICMAVSRSGSLLFHDQGLYSGFEACLTPQLLCHALHGLCRCDSCTTCVSAFACTATQHRHKLLVAYVTCNYSLSQSTSTNTGATICWLLLFMAVL